MKSDYKIEERKMDPYYRKIRNEMIEKYKNLNEEEYRDAKEENVKNFLLNISIPEINIRWVLAYIDSKCHRN